MPIEMCGEMREKEPGLYRAAEYLDRIRRIKIFVVEICERGFYNVQSSVHVREHLIPGNTGSRKLRIAVTYIIRAAENGPKKMLQIAVQMQAKIAGGIRHIARFFPQVGFILV